MDFKIFQVKVYISTKKYIEYTTTETIITWLLDLSIHKMRLRMDMFINYIINNNSSFLYFPFILIILIIYTITNNTNVIDAVIMYL
jgi:hypothetical protein